MQYEIEARVEPAQQRLDGKQRLRWRNATSQATAELWFHLYWNAFANNASTHIRGARLSPRGQVFKDGWGWQRLSALRIEGRDALERLSWRAPDDGNSADRSVFSVSLERAVLPGETLEIEIEWEAAIPRVRRRTGYKEDFLFIAQWFPKIGVLEEGRGWNCHQFHAMTEFYADYGTYDVTIDLPMEYAHKVGASGVQIGQAQVDAELGRVRTRFLAPSPEDRLRVDATGKRALVHDFAWTADPDYRLHQGTFYFADWARLYADEVERTAQALRRDPTAMRQRDVRVSVLVQPEHELQWQRHFDATCTALFFYGLWFGEYPYEHITAVDPAWGAGAAGGMEYPTLFTCGTEAFTSSAMQSPEGVTVHECGHQFWYGLVGNNEFEAAWMDEGFNSYTDGEALWRRYGAERAVTRFAGLPKWGLRPTALPGGDDFFNALCGRELKLDLGAILPGRPACVLRPLADSAFVDWWRDQPYLTYTEQWTDPRWHDRRRYVEDKRSDPVRRNAWQYADGASYRTNSYPRPAVVLRSLPALIGQDAFLRGLRHYAEEWRYRHPYPDDFVNSFCAGAGEDLGWYFEELLETTDTIDWSVEVSSREVPEPAGYFLAESGEFQLREHSSGVEPSASAMTAPAEQPAKLWQHDVLLRCRGGLELPVDVRLRFADGRQQDLRWTREQQLESHWWRLPLEPTQAKLSSVEIDPERMWWIDEDMSDNQWYAQEQAAPLAPLRWAERVQSFFGHLLHYYSTIGG